MNKNPLKTERKFNSTFTMTNLLTALIAKLSVFDNFYEFRGIIYSDICTEGIKLLYVKYSCKKRIITSVYYIPCS